VEDNIKMDLQEVQWGSMDWNDLAQDRDKVVSTSICDKEPLGSIKCREID